MGSLLIYFAVKHVTIFRSFSSRYMDFAWLHSRELGVQIS